MPAIEIKSSAGPYIFFCARGSLANSAALVKRLGDTTGVFVLSSPRIWRYWGKALAAKIPGARRPILFDDREQRKRLSTVEAIARALVRCGADRHSVDRALDILAARLLPPDVVVTHEFGLDDYRSALETAIDRERSQAIKVVFRP